MLFLSQIKRGSYESEYRRNVGATASALKSGDRISLVGFGSFSVSNRKERKGRNPSTGKEITIAAKNTIRFKAGSELSSSVN